MDLALFLIGLFTGMGVYHYILREKPAEEPTYSLIIWKDEPPHDIMMVVTSPIGIPVFVRGSCTVWHYAESGRRCSTSLEAHLSGIWTEIIWGQHSTRRVDWLSPKTPSFSIPVTREQVESYCFGEDRGEWSAFCEGWLYAARESKDAGAKELGLYPENQNLRISWERGSYACRTVNGLLGGSD